MIDFDSAVYAYVRTGTIVGFDKYASLTTYSVLVGDLAWAKDMAFRAYLRTSADNIRRRDIDAAMKEFTEVNHACQLLLAEHLPDWLYGSYDKVKAWRDHNGIINAPIDRQVELKLRFPIQLADVSNSKPEFDISNMSAGQGGFKMGRISVMAGQSGSGKTIINQSLFRAQ